MPNPSTYEEQTYRIAELSELREHPENPRQGDVGAIVTSVEANGFYGALIVQKSTSYVLAGNHRLKALRAQGAKRVPIIERDVDDRTAMRILLGDNRTADLATYDEDKLLELLLKAADEDNLVGTGYDGDDVDKMIASQGDDGPPVLGALSARFLVPPFSVLDARQGYWQERKRKWLALGIRSELGRGANLLNLSDAMLAVQAGQGYSKKPKRDAPEATNFKESYSNFRRSPAASAASDPAYAAKKREAEKQQGRALSDEEFVAEHYAADAYVGGTSIFDPVLCEIAYRWFSPPGGAVLDPFAGGSVRGVVAGTLGLRYTGIDLAGEQVKANRVQWRDIQPKLQVTTAAPEEAPEATTSEPAEITPVQQRGSYWLKRDDLFSFNGATGGKARATLVMAAGAEGIVAVSARTSPQNARAARVAQGLGIPCRCHTGIGAWTEELAEAELAGATIEKHKPARLSVMKKRAEDDAEARDWKLIPWGAVGPEAVHAAAVQTSNIPAEALRIVVPVGSGATLAGVLKGLAAKGDERPVLGVRVGADPTSVLDEYAPGGWRDRCDLVDAGIPFEKHAPRTRLEGLELEPTYEAKCIPFLRSGDLLWIVGGPARPPVVGPQGHPEPTWIEGDSRRLLADYDDQELGEAYDLVFSCPPYADLEKYSSDPSDISNMPYPEFLAAYRDIIREAVRRLSNDRFCVWVVGEVRDPKGAYRGLVPDTIRAFQDAGAQLYNEAILVTSVGSLALRAARFFEGSRKLGKTHQNVLVFVKGDPARAHIACGEVEVPAESFEGVIVEVAIEPDIQAPA